MYVDRVLILIILLCIAVLPVNAAIYQYKDSEGNISYSDKPRNGAKRIKESKPSVAPRPRPSPSFYKKSTSPSVNQTTFSTQKPKSKPKAKSYTTAKFANIKDDVAVRSNNGDLAINITLKPALQTKFDHKIQLIFDGKKLATQWKTSSILLKNQDRGTHTLSFIVLDKAGKKFKQGEKIKFHLLRYSIL